MSEEKSTSDMCEHRIPRVNSCARCHRTGGKGSGPVRNTGPHYVPSIPETREDVDFYLGT